MERVSLPAFIDLLKFKAAFEDPVGVGGCGRMQQKSLLYSVKKLDPILPSQHCTHLHKELSSGEIKTASAL